MSAPPLFRLRIGGRTIALHDHHIYVVGSDEAAAIRVVHGSIDPQHARLVVADGAVTLQDLGSVQGTKLRGERVAEVALQPGDRPSFGEVEAELTRLVAIMPAARSGRPGHRQETFQEVMARELAHAPWFVLSVLVHAALFLLLAVLLAPPPPGVRPKIEARIELPPDEDVIVEDDQPQVEPQVEEVERDETVTEPAPQVEEPQPVAEPVFDTSAFTSGFEGIGLTSLRGGRKGADGDDIFALGSDALRKGPLRGTVSRLRESGLEIVFVFDSTGSMDRVLSAAKRRIFRMVEALHALVPSARIGIVTYRDHGPTEEYVTRAVPVTLDVYRVMNFMHTIDAGGGGDFEEAVLDALRAATSQRFEPKSRRVVVLIGDAPPHRDDEGRLKSLIQAFARGQAFVHSIATVDGPRSRTPNPDTKRTFEDIAREGHGQFSTLEGEDTVLQQVLALAFGTEHRRDLDEVYALVEKRTQKTEVAALDVVQRADLKAIEAGLRQMPVDDEVVKAVIKLRQPDVMRYLIERLADTRLPPHGRQACSYAVMRLFNLPEPPLDPESDAVLPVAARDRLLRQLDR